MNPRNKIHKMLPKERDKRNYENQLYAAKTLCPDSDIALDYGSLVLQESISSCLNEAALYCSSLVLQGRKDLLSFSYGPTFTVLIMLRIEAASVFSTTKRTTQLDGQGMRNEAKVKNAARELLGARSLLEAKSRGNVAKGNTRAKTSSHSANATVQYIVFWNNVVKFCER